MYYVYELTDASPYLPYYGYTNNIKKRLSYHKNEEISMSKLLDNSTMVINILSKHENKEDARDTERYYQENYPCLNRQITGRTQGEWYIDNKERLLKKANDYYKENKKKVAERNKELIICDCGLSIKKSNKSNHLKSVKHKKLLIMN